MTSPASPYIAPEASDKKWWDPFGLFASKPAPSNPPSDFKPSSSPTGGRGRKYTLKKARRRHRSRKGGMETQTPMQKIKYGPKEYRFLTDGYKWDFPPTQSRVRTTKNTGTKVESPSAHAPKPTGKGRRTLRVKKQSRK